MTSNNSDVIDVESRVVPANPAGDSAAAATEATPAQLVSLETSLVPAFDAQKQIELANPALLQLNALKAEIASAKVDEIDVSTKDGEEKVRGLLRRCVKLRTSTEKAYDAWNRPLLDAQKGVRKVVKQVEDGITPDEARLEAIVKKIDDAREAEKQRKIEAERQRIAALREKISAMAAAPVAAVRLTSAEIDTQIRELQDRTISDADDSFGEFSDEAEALRGNVISQLLEMSASKRQAEEQQAELDRQRREQLERDRLAEIERGLRAKIQALQALAFSAMGKTAKQIKAVLDELVKKEPLAIEFGALASEAASTWVGAKVALEHALATQQRLEEQQAEQARVAAEQRAESERLAAERERAEEAERQRLEDERRRQEAADPTAQSDAAELVAAVSPAPAPAPTPAPSPAPAPVAEADPESTIEPPSVFEIGRYSEEALSAAGVLTMSMFANQEDFYAAVALQNLSEVWGDEHASPNAIAGDILNVLATGDFPTEQASELDLISLLLHEPVLECLRARRAALIAAVTTTNTEQVPA